MWVNGKRLAGVRTPSKNINESSTILLLMPRLKKRRVVLPVNGVTFSVDQIATQRIPVWVT
jgi:hypothetical protein